MKNRAKCKLCNSIIESFHSTDYVECNCGEIAVAEGSALKCTAKNWNNFIRIDEEGAEIPIKYSEYSKFDLAELEPSPSDHIRKGDEKSQKMKLIDELDMMIKNIESLPPHALMLPINHYDFCSLLILVSALFKADC